MLALLADFAIHSSHSSGGGDAGGLLNLLIYVVIIGLIFWCIWWFIGYCAPPEPFNKVIRVVVGLIALIIVINLLLGLGGHSFINW